MTKHTADECARHEAGFQCPECSGVRISLRRDRFSASILGYQCEECGCQWSRKVALHPSFAQVSA